MTEPAAGIGQAFAGCLGALDPGADARLLSVLERVSEAVAEGHVCVRLDACAGTPDASGAPTFPGPQALAERLLRSPLVGRPGDFRPLILDDDRLYLARYWRYEKNLADSLLQRAEQPAPGVDAATVRHTLDRLFADNRERPDWQKAAAATAVLRRLCVISGGPGTGKTSTVIRILAALLTHAGEESLRIGLAAPTGKAAARMEDAIRVAKQKMALDPAVRGAIPEHASTLHRLLGSRPDSVYFRHHRGNPLPLDVVVVDEASMIDLALMAKLVDALPDTARLILLGDKDQLASVEAGAVFGDICAVRGHSDGFRAQIETASGVDIGPPDPHAPLLGRSVVWLRHSYRFGADSGIGELARLINEERRAELVDFLHSGRAGDVAWRNAPVSALKPVLGDRLEQGYHAYFEAVQGGADPQEVFLRFNRFKVLTAHREGDAGVSGVNALMEERLRSRPGAGYPAQWYPGRPVMVTHNDYNLKLFNGDIGIALPEQGELRVVFQTEGGTLRSFAPGRLPPHETVYAMTVHKSQGSEFDAIVLLLPDTKTKVLNRSLVYTGVTRAKARVEIWGRQAVLEQAVMAVPVRASGLMERLLARSA